MADTGEGTSSCRVIIMAGGGGGEFSQGAIRSARLVALLALGLVAWPLLAGDGPPVCRAIDVPVLRLETPPSQYSAFCAEHPEACALDGTEVLALTPETLGLLAEVNRAVNTEITFMSDPDCWGVEELWSFPDAGVGDCEDYALEKRRRLVAAGMPSAALTMAIVYNMDGFYLHAVLLAETDAGTLLLDNLSDALHCWDEPPYRWYLRERPDGQWTRFARP